jgi:hypothetical protein
MFPLETILTQLDIENTLDQKTFRKAIRLAQSGSVSLEDEDPHDSISGLVMDEDIEYYAEVELRGNQAFVSCDCDQGFGLCVHAAALLIAVTFRQQRGPVYPGSSAKHYKKRLPYSIRGVTQEEQVRDLKTYLSNLTIKDLRELANRRGIKVSGLKRDLILEQLLEGLAEPQSLPDAVNRLPIDSRLVFSFTAILAEGINYNIHISSLAPFLDAALTVLGNQKPARSAIDCLDELRRLGMLFGGQYNLQVPLQTAAYQEIHAALFQPAAVAKDQIKLAQPFSLVRTALHLLALAFSGQLKCEKPARRDRDDFPILPGEGDRQVLPVPSHPKYLNPSLTSALAGIYKQSEGYINLLAQMLETMKLWAPRQPERISLLFREWLGDESHSLSRALFHQFILEDSTHELDNARTLGGFEVKRTRGSTSWGGLVSDLSGLRLRLLDLIARAPTGEWLEINHLMRLVYALFPHWGMDFQQSGVQAYSNRSGVKIYQEGKVFTAGSFDVWMNTYGWLHLVILTHTLHGSGLLDIAYRNSQPYAFRISDFGAFLLGRKLTFHDPAAAASGGLKFGPGAPLILKPMEAHPDLMRLVLRIASPYIEEKASSKKKLVELPFAVTLQDLQFMFSTGHHIEALISDLEAAANEPMPRPYRQLMEQVWERFGKLHLYPGMTLIEFADDYCLSELLAGTSLSQILVHTFSPRLIAIQQQGLAGYLDELAAKGYTPRLEASHEK